MHPGGHPIGAAARASARVFDILGLALEVKAVDVVQRVIEGYASITGNEDSNGDIIEKGAFTRTLGEHAKSELKDLDAYVGHDRSLLPVGIPLEVREDAKGLYTKTRIHNSNAGDDLLNVARERLEAGKPMGMSIGYLARDFTWEGGAAGGKRTSAMGGLSMKRRIKDLDLGEFSFTAIPANPKATVVSVKSRDGAGDGDAPGRFIELKSLATLDPTFVVGVATADRLATDLAEWVDAAMSGALDVKSGARMRSDMRKALSEIRERIDSLAKWASYDDDEAAAAAAAATAGNKSRADLLAIDAAVAGARSATTTLAIRATTSGGVN